MIRNFLILKKTLRNSKSSLAEAQHIGRIGNWDWKIDENTLHWSDEMCRIFGFRLNGVRTIYEMLLASVHPEDLEFVEDTINEALCSLKPYDIDHRIVMPDGKEKIVHDMMHIYLDCDGAPVRMIGTVQDITDRTMCVKATIESEKKYRALFEESRDAIMICTPEGRVLDINRAGIDLFGYSPGKNLFKANIADDLSPGDWERLIRGSEKNGFVTDLEVETAGGDGEAVVLSVNASTAYDGDGKIVAYRITTRDIGEQKKLGQQLLHAQKMETIGQLTSGIAHDFNNIVTSIVGFGRLALKKIGKDDLVKSYIEEIILSSNRATNLTQGLLAFSRKQVMRLRPLNINEVINNSKNLISMVLSEGVELKVSFERSNLIAIADDAQLEQVLMNLATNANHAMSGGGTLSISTETAELDAGFIKAHGYGEIDKYACITVTDTGTGMDEEDAKKIFEPFFTTKGTNEGTGLGLAIVYGIIKQHNGYINVESTPSCGSTFRIYLPFNQDCRLRTRSASSRRKEFNL